MRLDEIADEYGDSVELVWRSFMLRPQPEERPREKFVAYTRSWERPAALEPRVTFNPWASENEPPSHSLPAAVAGKTAATFGADAYREFHHRTMAAYFTDNRTISDWSVLLDIAEESGIDREEFDRRRQAGAEGMVGEIVSEHNEAIGAGISGVPALVVGERYLVPGAVDVADYRSVIDRYLAERAGAGAGDESDGS